MMAFGAEAFVTVLAGDVVEENPTLYPPGCMLGISQRVDINHRRAESGSNVDRAGVVGD
jgi:hypothetical protein